MPHLALAAALVIVSVRVPLSGYAIPSTVDGSPVLYAVYWLTGEVGEPGVASTLVAAVVGLLSLVAVLASRRPRLGTPVAIGLALLAIGATSAGAVAFDVDNTRLAKKAFLPSDPSWVDRTGSNGATFVQAWGGLRAASLQELFWNRSITQVALLPGAPGVDRFADDHVTIGKDGSLLVGGQALATPLVMDGFGSTIELRGARLVEAAPTASLWTPAGRPRLKLYTLGRYHDGWLANAGAIYVWPAAPGRPLAGWLSMRLTSTADAPVLTITFQLPGRQRTSIRIAPGTSRRLNIAICSDRDWYATFRSDKHASIGPRLVSVKSTAPVFTPSPTACPVAEPVA